MQLKPGTLLQGGKYRIVRFIKSGGFGCTYEAVLTIFGSRVAIKEFFPKDFCNRDESTSTVTVGTQSKQALVAKLKTKFVDEAKVLHSLSHPGIVKVTDVFEENGTAYYVMDYIDGCSLDDVVKHDGALSEKDALAYIRQVCSALDYVHSQNRLHLDIKPGNIMIDKDGGAVLIDFGASKQYDEENGEDTSSILSLTPGYAPLEQYSKEEVAQFAATADIYALGATLYKLLSGNTPTDAISRASGVPLHPLPQNVTPAVSNAVYSAMNLEKKKRPQSAAEFMVLFDEMPPPPPPKDRRLFQNMCRALIGMAIVINVYAFVEATECFDYYNMSYPHILLLCLLLFFTLVGILASWWLKVKHKRSRLITIILMLLLFSAGLSNLYLLAFESSYIEKDASCENVYTRREIMSSENDKYMVQDDIIPFRRWGKYGLMKGSTGEVVLSAQYDYISLWGIAIKEFSEEFGWVPVSSQEYDKENNVIFEVERDGKHGVLNVKGEVVIPVVYDYWRECYGMYVVGRESRYGIISKLNEEILPLEYSEISSDWGDNIYPYVIASKNGLWGVTDLEGTVHVPFDYEGIHLSEYFGTAQGPGKNTMFAYKRNGSWGVKDISGKDYLLCEYDEIRKSDIEDYLKYGYWRVSKGGKEGVLNKDSKVVIPFEYYFINLYSSRYGLFCVEEVDNLRRLRSGVVNINNEVILPLKSGSIHIDENTITRDLDSRGKEIYNHSGERIN